jgi:hypothetical protein
MSEQAKWRMPDEHLATIEESLSWYQQELIDGNLPVIAASIIASVGELLHEVKQLKAEIVANAQEAMAFRAMAERGWHCVRGGASPEIDEWYVGHWSAGLADILGSGLTPLAAVMDALEKAK